MKTTLVTLLLATALSGAVNVASATNDVPKATATVELLNPEDFTDFKLSRMGGTSDVEYLGKELRREINRQAGNILPAGYRVLLRIHDIDLAGDFEPHRLPPYDDVRIMRGVYAPRMKLEYSVTDEAGNVVASGERNLTDLGYEYRLRRPGSSDRKVEIESEMVGDFFREIARATS